MQLGRFFLREQPCGTWIDDVHPWTIMAADPTVDPTKGLSMRQLIKMKKISEKVEATNFGIVE